MSSFVGFGDFGLSFILGHSLSEDSRSKMAQSQRVARNCVVRVKSEDEKGLILESAKKQK